MTRTHRHLLYSLVWLFAFIVIFVLASSSLDASDIGKTQFHSQIGSLVWVLGFAAIFFSWARVDVVEHGKSKGAAVVFAALWPFLVFFAHIAYLFYTRGMRDGLVAVLKFICFLLTSGIGLLVFGKLIGFAFG